MRKLELNIEETMYEKLEMALKLKKESINDAISGFIVEYINKSFAEAMIKKSMSIENDINENVSTNNENYGMAKRRIPKWAKNRNQINHKIVRAFFEIENEKGVVKIEDIKNRCSDPNKTNTFVRDFRGNFSQMKYDAPKSHGKVFDVNDGNIVTIWDEVKEVLEKYKKCFL